jgi:Cu/Ag efflux pump CusA
MVTWLMDSAVRLRRLVVAAIVAVLALGLVQLQKATVDVYPEYEATTVQVQTDALGLSAYEVEQLITVPMEQNLLNGIPRLEEIRSRSMSGVSVVDLTFEPGTDVYLARQLVQERMGRINLLPHVGTAPTMIQPTASTSRVAMVGMRSDSVSLIDMSVLARWTIRPRLMSIPGVAAVSVWGLRDRQLQVQVDPERLIANNVTLTQVIGTTGNALWVSPLSFLQASTPGTGGFLESPNQRIGVQHVSPITASEQLADVTVQRTNGPPVRLGDLADVTEDHQPLIGDATSGGEQSLMLVVERFPEANTAQVSRDVEAALDAMAPGLTGITMDPTVYRPAAYLDSALERLALAVLIGLALMVAVIAVVALSWRVAVIAFVSVAVSLVAALWVLHLRGATLTTMTVIGLATVMALVIDDAVGDVTELRARFAERRADGASALGALAAEVLGARRRTLIYATVVILVALTPLLLLGGTAGAFARPALLTFALAALTSLVAALVVTPTLAVLLLGGRGARPGRGAPFAHGVNRGVDRVVAPSVGRKVPAFAALAVLVALALTGVFQMRSGDILPEVQDRNVLVRLEAAPGTALAEMNRITSRAAEELRSVSGVEAAGTHVGRAVGGDVIVDVDASEIWVTIGNDADYSRTLEAVRSTIDGYPGVRNEVRTYGQAQLDAAGSATVSSSDDELVVRVYGQDFDTLRQTAEQVREALATVTGVITPTVEAQPAQPVAEIHVDLEASQEYGLQPGDVRRAASTLVSGLTVGNLYEQQAIFDVVIWGGPANRHSVLDLENLLIDAPSGVQVRLGDVATVVQTSDPTVIGHHAVSRSLDVTAVVQGRDIDEVAAAATERLQQMDYPYEYRAEVIVDPTDRSGLEQPLLVGGLVAALLVFLLFQAATGSWRGAAVLFACVPLAGVGGILAGLLLGDGWTLGVLAAIFAAVALTVRQALVLVRGVHAAAADAGGKQPAAVMLEALKEKAPAMLAAVLVTAAAFLPAAVMGGGAGLELLQPFAITLLAGLLTSVVVVLFLVPALYPAVGGLTATGGQDDDPDADTGRHLARGTESHLPVPRPETHPQTTEPHAAQERGGAMERNRSARTHRSAGIASLFVAAGLTATSCQAQAEAPAATEGEEPAVVEPADDGGPAELLLSAEAVTRIGLETAAVATSPQLAIPYSAVVYDSSGDAWTFAVVDERKYKRAAITIADIVGDVAILDAGPTDGTEVVTVGAAELVGVEAGISGGE